MSEYYEEYQQLAMVILPIVKDFLADGIESYPMGMGEDGWISVLKEIEWSFQQVVDQKDDGYHLIRYNGEYVDGACCKDMGKTVAEDVNGKESYRLVGCDCVQDWSECYEFTERLQNGFELFGKHFRSFWH